MTRLPWLGEWATPEMVAGVLRPLFLNTVSQLVPSALEALRDDVLRVYERPASTKAGGKGPGPSREEADPACDPTSNEAERERVPTDYHMIRYEHDRTADRDLFTDDEAAVLFDQGYELLGDLDATGPGRFYLWRPKEGHLPDEETPEASCEDYDELDHYHAEVRAALRRWGERFHLTDEWILNIAWRQLDVWHRHWYLAYPQVKWPRATGKIPLAHDQGTWSARLKAEMRDAVGISPEAETVGPVRLEWLVFPAVAWFLPTSAEERRLSFEHEGWDPTTATKAAARRHILANFGQFLDAYLDQIERVVLDNRDGWLQTPDYTALKKHMEWLVRYQCPGESFPHIDRSASGYKYATGETVEKPVRRLAKLMDVQLRPGTHGRPPGSENRPKRKRRRSR